MTFVSELEPKELWKHFDRILEIPRGSKNEAAAAEYVIRIARGKNLEYERDEAGNVVVRKPAARDLESVPVTILQGHLDMVNEKNADFDHDFEEDAIEPVRDGDYLKARGTTLGSDNGIGVAASLAVLESDVISHGPMEFLFTVDEETGLTGASNLQEGFLRGKILINLDTEEEGALYVGCAGGAGVNLNLALNRKAAAKEDLSCFELKLGGLRGGHSGVDIHLQRANAIKLLARILREASESTVIRLGSISGGNMHNAIPREAQATVLVSSKNGRTLEQSIEKAFDKVEKEFQSVDPGIRWELSASEVPKKAMDEKCSRRVILLLDALPHGVMAMSNDIPDLVETSSNLATIRTDRGLLRIHVSNRSSVESALSALQRRVGSIAMLAGAEVEFSEGYPAWEPNMESRILKVARRTYKSIFGEEPEVKAVHAGLECGIIGEKYPDMDMLSFGPQIEYPHSPDERVEIASVKNFYQLLTAVLEDLAADTKSD